MPPGRTELHHDTISSPHVLYCTKPGVIYGEGIEWGHLSSVKEYNALRRVLMVTVPSITTSPVALPVITLKMTLS